MNTSPTNAPGYFKRYTDQVAETDLFTAFENQSASLEPFLKSITEAKSAYAYAPGKWTIKELVQHLIDAEKIFCYRALCFARGEKITLPGFDENEYAANSFANERSWESIVNEFLVVREGTIAFFKSLHQSTFSIVGTAGTNSLSVETLGFIILGHCIHHQKILQERYLV